MNAVLNANCLSSPRGTLQCLRLPTGSTVPADVHLGSRWSEENIPEKVKICASVRKAGEAVQNLNATEVYLVYVQQGQR